MGQGDICFPVYIISSNVQICKAQTATIKKTTVLLFYLYRCTGLDVAVFDAKKR